MCCLRQRTEWICYTLIRKKSEFFENFWLKIGMNFLKIWKIPILGGILQRCFCLSTLRKFRFFKTPTLEIIGKDVCVGNLSLEQNFVCDEVNIKYLPYHSSNLKYYQGDFSILQASFNSVFTWNNYYLLCLVASIMATTGKKCEIYVGAKFSSFAGFKDAIERYQQNNYVQLYISDSRTLQAAMKRVPKLAVEAPDDLTKLHYYCLTYACIRGGRKHRNVGRGICPDQYWLKRDCPAKIQLRVDKKCKNLKVIALNEKHNHEVSQESFQRLPHQRKLAGMEDVHTAVELQFEQVTYQSRTHNFPDCCNSFSPKF